MKQTRRDFIRTAALSGAALATGNLWGAPAAAVAGGGKESGADKVDTWEYSRRIRVERSCDILIAGGGPAGVAAAVAAARLGARVVVAEATGCLGGMGTSGLVTAFDPMANGERMLVGGIMREIVYKMWERGFLSPATNPDIFAKRYMYWTPFQAEGYKLLLDEMVQEAGVEVRFFTRVIDADADPRRGEVRGAVLQNQQGLTLMEAEKFIDCTGDAILSEMCGARYRQAGRDTPKIMPATLCSYFAGVDFSRAVHVGTGHPILLKAIADGHFSQYDKHLPGLSQVDGSLGYLNGGQVFGLDALSNRSMSEGMMKGRRIVREYLDFYRKYVPGFENAQLAATGSTMGIRESRRVAGEYELTIDDYLARRTFPDQIAIFNKSVDIHAYEPTEEEFQRYSREYNQTHKLKPGEYFGIPYSILVPKGWSNLWVAGRCSSSDIQVHGAIRVQPPASMMGQAAGTAAVQSLRTGQPAADLNTEMLVTTLRSAGANLPQEKLSKTMTR
jgi:hypothetical protein